MKEAQVNLGLVGNFKYDLFSGGQLVESSDFFPNFITQTGLNYPNIYSFADCFRFLSLGTSAVANSGTTTLNFPGTTGLNSPLTGFLCNDGSTCNTQYIGWQGYASGFCGTVVSNAGPRLFRAWNIPTGVGLTINDPNVNGGIQISEFMVSPGSGSDTTGCFAFSRVTKNLFIPNGYNAVITYQLQVLIQNTGITFFNAGTFVTGNADISTDYELIREWGNLSGYYRQIYHGLRAVDTNGITYIPWYGDGMEPSTEYLNSMVFYLSPDNAQFDVNPIGGTQTNINSAYAADGLRKLAGSVNLNVSSNNSIPTDPSALNALFYNNNPTVNPNIPSPDLLDTPPSYFKNLRIGDSNNTDINPGIDNYSSDAVTVNYQQQQDYSDMSISYATPGASGYNNSLENYGQQGVVSSKTVQFPLNLTVNSGQNLITGRHKMITRKSIFSPVSSLGWNTRFGSMVYAFWYNQGQNAGPGNQIYFPYIDTMFFDSSGRSTMAHYRYITGIYLTQRGSGILNCNLALTSGNNIKQFVSLPTFQGGYQGSPNNFTNLLSTFFDTTFAPNYSVLYGGPNYCYSGLVLDGNGLLPTDIYGTTEVVGDGLGNSGNGLGAIYGLQTNDYFCLQNSDLGIYDHSLYNQVSSPTGALGWPLVLPFGTPVLVIPTNLQYFDTGFDYGWPALIDSTNWFNGKSQIIKRIDFYPVNSGNTQILTTKNKDGGNLTGFYSNVFSEPQINLDVGYYLTTGQFTGNQIQSTGYFRYDNSPITGYYIGDATVNGNLVFGDLYRGGNLPSSSVTTGFSVLVSGGKSPLGYISGTYAGRVTGLFATFQERGFLSSNSLSDGCSYDVFFTGFNQTNARSYYITNVLSADAINGPFTGYSIISGKVNLTRYCPPTGFAEHVETTGTTQGYRLLPNYGVANYYGQDIYSPTVGGTLPGLSLDNSLEVYLSISWSSPCPPGVTPCVNPV